MDPEAQTYIPLPAARQLSRCVDTVPHPSHHQRTTNPSARFEACVGFGRSRASRLDGPDSAYDGQDNPPKRGLTLWKTGTWARRKCFESAYQDACQSLLVKVRPKQGALE